MPDATNLTPRGLRILVTGGTGSFGQHIIRALLPYKPKSLIVFSRDEKKQWDLMQALDGDVVECVVGDVRDHRRLRDVMSGIDMVFHAAALKQVPSCERAPFEATLTNVFGAENLRAAAIAEEVAVVVGLSTDKAVKPVNAMGMTKALQEKILLQPQPQSTKTRFVCVRYGNVLGSRGSVIPLFHRQIEEGRPLTLTHPDMTRFQLTLSEAVELVLSAAGEGKHGELWVRKMPAARISDLARALAEGLTGSPDYPQVQVGLRPGEKMHEVLVSEEEMWRAREHENFFVIASGYARDGNPGPTSGAAREYSSDTTSRLSIPALTSLLREDGWFQSRPVERTVSSFDE